MAADVARVANFRYPQLYLSNALWIGEHEGLLLVSAVKNNVLLFIKTLERSINEALSLN